MVPLKTLIDGSHLLLSEWLDLGGSWLWQSLPAQASGTGLLSSQLSCQMILADLGLAAGMGAALSGEPLVSLKSG